MLTITARAKRLLHSTCIISDVDGKLDNITLVSPVYLIIIKFEFVKSLTVKILENNTVNGSEKENSACG